MASLSPEEIQQKQRVVFNHVQQEQITSGLTDEDATKLLIDTLQHNGLPVPESLTPPTITRKPFIQTSVNSVTETKVEDLPQKGTWEHTFLLTLFNIQQSFNLMLMDTFGDINKNTNNFGLHHVKTDKIGQAVFDPGDTSSSTEDDGILATVASLPGYLSSAAFQITKFVLPPLDKTSSEVSAGFSPTNAALGLLAVGALASVFFIFVAPNTDVIPIITDSINIAKRKGISNAVGDAFASLLDNDIKNKVDSDGDIDLYYDYDPASNAGYSDYGYGYPTFPIIDKRLLLRNQDSSGADRNHLPKNVEFYEPEHNPWKLLGNGQNTQHLYRSFSKRDTLI